MSKTPTDKSLTTQELASDPKEDILSQAYALKKLEEEAALAVQEEDEEVEEEVLPAAPLHQSATLRQLPSGRRPTAKTVCEECPNSVWYSTPKELQCYCRVMFMVIWKNKAPTVMTSCDGVFVNQDKQGVGES